MALADDLRRLFEIGRHRLRLVRHAERQAGHHVVETLRFDTEAGDPVRGVVTKPKHSGPHPAMLYVHAHGGRYGIGAAELLDGRPALQSPLGPVLAREGFVTLCIDLPCFGERATIGESAAAKAALWHGRSLAGQMMGELSSALDYLAARQDVDTARIGAFGISMGATYTYWLAAVDQRIKAAMHLCCFADFDALIAAGAHDLHGIYLTVPGLLDVAGNGEIAGLIAPRPQLVCVGDRDALTPPAAFEPAWAQLLAAYDAAGAADALVLHREAETGHQESVAMRQRMLAFAARHLRDVRS